MSEFFKSALNFVGGGSGNRDSTDFVGQTVELGQYKLRIKKFLAEGGFAYVFAAQDVSNGKDYALKRLFAHDDEKAKEIVREVKIHKRVSGHPHIVDFVAAASIGKEEGGAGKSEYLVLSEYCSAGPVIDLLNARGRPFECNTVLHVFWQLCSAVQHLHGLQPALIHRDIKLENLLLTAAGVAKLCDFGSSTTTRYEPDMSWSALQRGSAEDEIAKNTTPMYRAPEMLDLYQNLPINEAADIWALGCVLFLLSFYEHPFEDGAKLKIINAKFTIPASDKSHTVCHDLIRSMLEADPRQRPPIVPLTEQVQEIATSRGVKLNSPLQLGQAASPVSPTPQQPPPRPAEPPRGGYQQASAAQSLFGALKGGAGSLVRNIAAASNKVMETVQASINKSDLDFSYITSRIAVMSSPAEGVEAAIKNHFNDVKSFLDSRHPGSYAVYNLTDKTYPPAKFDNRVSDCRLPQRRAPALHTLYDILNNMHLFLRQDAKNVCVLHCADGKSVSASVVVAFLCFCRLCDSVPPAQQMFCARRCQPGLLAAHTRYIDYICRLNSGQPSVPHNRAVKLETICMSPIPLFNRMRNGVRPFVEVYVGTDRVLTTSQQYENMKGFSAEDGVARIPIGVSVTGDVTILAYHARSTFGGKVQGKITSMKIFQVQFHTGMISPETSTLQFKRAELDQLDADVSKYPEAFGLYIEVSVADQERPVAGAEAQRLRTLITQSRSPKILFSSRDEMKSVSSQFGAATTSPSSMSPESPASPEKQRDAQPSSTFFVDKPTKPAPTKPTPPARPEPPTANFFDTLDWASQPSNESAAQQESNEAPASTILDAAPAASTEASPEVDLLGMSSDPVRSEQSSQPPTDEFDLLGLNNTQSTNQGNSQATGSYDPFASTQGHEQTASNAFDMFANFEQTEQPPVSEAPKPDLFDPLNSSSQPEQAPDLLQSWNADNMMSMPRVSSVGNNLNAPQTNIFRNASSGHLPNQQQAANQQTAAGNQPNTAGGQTNGKLDPFAALTDLGSLGGSSQSSPQHRPSTPQQGQAGRGSAPMGQVPGGSQQSWHSPSHTATGAGRGAATKPNYNTSAFDTRFTSNSQKPTKSNNSSSDFADLLGAGFTSKQSGPRTIDEMRKKDLEETLDPETLKVREWTARKERNLRALLCSLHQILWEDEGRWKEIGMHQLVTANDVKKWYRKAVLSVHPDKLQDSPNLPLARAIFVELNEAWAEFEQKGSKDLYT